jgi:Carboxypeptidase regulatory-like domain/TonB dependent receptor
MLKNFPQRAIAAMLFIALSALIAPAQQTRGTLRGVISDELGAAIVGATVTLRDVSGQEKAAVTNGDGAYSFNAVGPGKYTVRATAKGFAASEVTEVEIKAGQRETLDLTLKVTIEEQKVNIAAETPVSTEATANADQTIITGKDLDALPDDPDELAAALQALAGPSVGPNGGQIFIDGFTGGTLPSKSSIREIRINQNPFAAENDQPSGRIDIFTKPGTDKLKGSSFFNFNDGRLNSRNPFAANRPPFQVRQFGGNLSGPLVAKKASYFVDVERREINDNELVTATVLDSNLNAVRFGEAVLAPRRFVNFSPRLDYALNSSNTLVARYSYFHQNLRNNGVNGFSLPERAFDSLFTSHNIQLTETAMLSPTVINETRFQFTHSRNESLGDSSRPALIVSGSFIGGSSQVGHLLNTDQRWELQNFTAVQKGQHAYKVGGRMRGVHVDNINPSNFGGQYFFTGGLVPQLDTNNNPIPGTAITVDSLERYRRTLLLQRQGFTPTEIRTRGGGAAQFTINTGNPEATVSQFDIGVYAQDDWRVRPNITLSYGLRYEYQTNTHSPFNFAPRGAIAWSPGAANSARPPKMVIRAGFGIFYNRFNENNTLQAHRFNGVNEEQFIVKEIPLFTPSGQVVPPASSPLDAFPNIPPVAGLTAFHQITWRVASDLRTPTFYGGGVQVERQLPKNFTMFAGIFILQIQHVIRARDINAPLPGTITTTNLNGVRPFGNIGDIYQYESSGRYNQNQIYVGFNNRFSRSISFFGNYSLSHTHNDTDGQGSASFPVNSYDTHGEYGRASFDIRHRFSVGGTWSLPWWGLSLNPLIFASTGAPFNIITGIDTNGDGVFMERPSFAPAGVACSGPSKPANIVCTRFGNFNLLPALGEQLIPRNYGSSPGYFNVNLTVSKTWNFGTIHSSKSANQKTGAANTQGVAAKAAAGGPMVGGAGAAKVAGGGIPGLGPGGLGGGAAKEAKRYSMQFSISFSNLFNHANLRPLEGNLSSPYFGESLGLSQFGGGGGGAPGSVGAGNRRIIGRVRFNF